MADINVERRGPTIWPWVVGLLVLALLVWVLVEMFGRSGEPRLADPLTEDIGVNAPAGIVTDTI